jgi:ethanolamine transporter EutH
MLSLAFDGITSLSVKPIRMITGFGIFVTFVSLVLLIYSIVQHFLGNTDPGWTSIMVAICFLGGVQLISLGVIGEYVGKTYMETKARPRYIISERTYDTDGE